MDAFDAGGFTGKGLIEPETLLRCTADRFEGKGILANTFILLIAALLCSVLPVRFIPVVSAVFIVGHSFPMGIDVFAVCAIIILALTFLFLRFVPDDSPAIIFMPIAMHFGIPALVPICYGLRKRPSAVLAVGSGCILYYLLSAVTSNKEALLEFGKTEYVARLTLLMESINSGNEMVVSILALSGVVVIVFAFRRLGFAHAYEVACVSGGLVYLFFIILGNSISLTQFDLAREGIGAAAAIIVSLILQFFWLSLDFKKVEVLEFEDDRYYYHVKAVPKITAEDFAETADADGESVNFEQKLEDSLRNL